VRLTQDLGLDAEQQAAVRCILAEQRAKMEAERSQSRSSGSRPSHEEMRTRHEQRNAELRAQLTIALTDEQIGRFDALPRRHRYRQ
jgi:hypothetical protein